MDDFRQVINYDELTSEATIALARIAAEAIRGLNWTTNSGQAAWTSRPSPTTSSARCRWPPAGWGSCSARSPATSTGRWPPGTWATISAKTPRTR